VSEELSPATEQRFEPPPIKGSRFIAHVAPARNEAEARSLIARIGKEFSDARHTCWAMRIGSPSSPGFLERSSDDGEPSGSAGRPILAQLAGHGMSDTVAVVVRYFGGVKLGVGGLMRAYGGAAGQCLDRAKVRAIVRTRHLTLHFAWEQSGAVEALLTTEGISPRSSDYGASVTITIEVPEVDGERITSSLRDRTGGKITVSAAPTDDS
jgi:uncharacterized YigZ family protein